MSKKRLRFLVMMLAVLAIGSILFAACTRPGTIPSATTHSGSTSGSGGGNGGGSTVHMGLTNFLVSSVNIPKGSKLTLIDDVASTHIIKNGSWVNGAQKLAKEPTAPTVDDTFSSPGDTKTIGPFSTAGTYHILCIVHVNMNLTITVQ